MAFRSDEPPVRGHLAAWLVDQGLLRGPFVFTDYWSSVLWLDGDAADRRQAAGLLDRGLFRLGIDRPDLELPRLRYYLILFFAGPFLLPFRFFRRLGRYRIRVRSGFGEQVLAALSDYRLQVTPAGGGRVTVRRPASAGDGVIVHDIIDPLSISGFSSLFLAAYKLPLAALTAIVLVGIATPALVSFDVLEGLGLAALLPGFGLLVLLLFAVFREPMTSVLGALPVLIAGFLYRSLELGTTRDWGSFTLWLVILFGVYLVVDLFFFPRPVPPTVFLYTKHGDGNPYDRPEDAPWWLEGSAYWVWRYLMLTPAEINKPWERDWERVDLWIRADGNDAGQLEWVVTDGHYRELWTPFERLGPARLLDEHRTEARKAADTGAPGTWLVEVDANLLFHTPFYRAVSFVPDEGRVPARRVWHLVRAMWSRSREPDVDAALERLQEIRLRHGPDPLDDLPELIADRAARHILSQPWTRWRYPLGANRRYVRGLYGSREDPEPLAASDEELQIKWNAGGSSDIS